ncbi:MAG: glycosyltransferase, partial [Cyanobacteria bacterium J06555_13]
TDFVVGYVGRLDRHKGVETLIKGFAELCKTNSAVHLAIAGKPHNDNANYLTELKSLAVHLDVANSVTFLGHVDNPAQVYQASDVVVLPSEWPEPFGRTVIESLSCGVPVLASCVGGIPEILTDQLSQGLFESANPHSLAEKLRQHLSWREHTPDLSDYCRNHVVDNFSLGTAIENVEKTLFKSLSV